ncbi:hypothetical protein H7K45_02465 [Mycobacterium yunnanensis]|uniref:Transcriptional regulator, AbiEi antitoxin, Type IV TA system n=1 Tax=Mycobacterium yunnanensis TaxID=368477 RepID=A0A9X3BYU4_9MYCO|nr:hypothetical protein [Mycobacterium yunnanensis]MCV7419393.1 hypothetical protein [Mycobacterium yunnanensis]
MDEVFVGSERLASGRLTRGQLRWNYAPLFPGVYAPKSTAASLRARTVGAWLWSGRDGIVAGRAAAAIHGAQWIRADTPIELIARRDRSPTGIIARNERIDSDEVMAVGGLLVTTPARTAADLARHLRRDEAVRHLDALAAATHLSADDALALLTRHPRARGLRRAPTAIGLMDPGGQSPKETWLRLLYCDAGFPRPTTQIPVTDGVYKAVLDMGWEDILVAADFDGSQHLTDRKRYVHDIGRNEMVARQGWFDLHVVAEHSRAYIVRRTADAFAQRGRPLRLRRRS